MVPNFTPNVPQVQQPAGAKPPSPLFVSHAASGIQLGCPTCTSNGLSLGDADTSWPLWQKLALGLGIFAGFVTFYVIATKAEDKFGYDD